MQIPTDDVLAIQRYERMSIETEVRGVPVFNSTEFSLVNNVTEVYLADIESTSKDKLNFTWECIDFSESQMVIQLYFENPLFVSATDEPSQLLIVFNNETALLDIEGHTLDPDLELSRRIPTQMDSKLGEQLDGATTAASNSAKIFLAGEFILSMFFVGGLSQLLKLNQNLSVIVHMQLLNVQSPPNAQVFFSKLLSIVAFDVIDGLPIEDKMVEWLGIQQTEPLLPEFDILGY